MTAVASAYVEMAWWRAASVALHALAPTKYVTKKGRREVQMGESRSCVHENGVGEGRVAGPAVTSELPVSGTAEKKCGNS